MGSRNGSILIVSLWILLILSTCVVSLAFRGGQEAAIARGYYEQMQRTLLMRSAVRVGAMIIENDQEPLVDHQNTLWATDINVAECVEREEYEPIVMTIHDEESKLNINAATYEMIEALLTSLRDEHNFVYDQEKAAEEIMAYRGVGVSNSSGLSPVAGSFFSVFEELALLKETKKLVTLPHRGALTVFPQDAALKVNVNTASEEVLWALFAGVVGDDGVKRECMDAVFEYRESVDDDGEPRFFNRKMLVAYKFIDEIGLTREVRLVSVVVQFLRFLTVNSQYFTIEVSHQMAPGRVEAIVGPHVSAQDGGLITGAETNELSVLSWREF